MCKSCKAFLAKINKRCYIFKSLVSISIIKVSNIPADESESDELHEPDGDDDGHGDSGPNSERLVEIFDIVGKVRSRPDDLVGHPPVDGDTVPTEGVGSEEETKKEIQRKC